nr:glycosyltransferase [Oceanibium sediminis]
MTPPRVLVLAFDRQEVSQRRAIRAMQATGAEVSSASFHRSNMTGGGGPLCPDIDLGACPNGLGAARLSALLRGAWRLIRARRRLGRPEVIVARNLDLALLGLLARSLSGGSARLVYQCLDIHGLMTARTLGGALARWAERRVLARADCLVVSAPRFLSAYFGPIQGYAGRTQVLENRIVWGASPPPRPRSPRRAASGPLTLGWVGTLRCPRTFDVLEAAARRAGPEVLRIRLRGVVHHHQLPDFHSRIAACPGLIHDGTYTYPYGLQSAYAGLDYVWAQDLWQSGGNSDWLLPNRLYEAGYFACPMLAIEGTATAERIRSWACGVALPAPTADALLEALPHLRAAREGLARNLLARAGGDFTQDPAEVAAMLTPSAKAARSGAVPGFAAPSARYRSRIPRSTCATGSPRARSSPPPP